MPTSDPILTPAANQQEDVRPPGSMIVDFLRRLPLFGGLPEEDLERLCGMAEVLSLAAGQVLIEEGQPADSLYIIVDGEFEVSKNAGDQDLVLARRGSGEVLGEMSLLDDSPRFATVRAVDDGRVIRIGHDAFRALLAASPAAVVAILQTVGQRLRSSESLIMQHAKMAALGSLSAGLAHELNNPAASVQRSAAHLREALEMWQSLAAALETPSLSPAQREEIRRLQAVMPGAAVAAQQVPLDPLAYSEQETAVQDWLEEQGVAGPWTVAPPLVAAGWNITALNALAALFAVEQVPLVAAWLSAGLAVYGALHEIDRGAGRIAELVGAVKRHSYLDQAPIQDVNVRDGLEDTLIILRHKLREGIRVVREYAPRLPSIEAYASELNQVWTNLIDNALDAMAGGGTLFLRTQARPEQVVVEIVDDGPGIPPEVQSRIFDPFFTTKPIGAGTGLGLHIAYNIVVHKHGGQLELVSQPGRTCFRVVLPLRLGSAS